MRQPSFVLHRARRSRRGFSIIEILVSIIIIGILVTVLLPVVSSRSEQARIARVQQDLQTIGDAQERIAIDMGYYVRLFAVNDVLRGDGVAYNRALPADVTDRADGMTDYQTVVAQTFLQFPTNNSLFIDTRTGGFAGVNRDELIGRLLASESRYDGTVIWNGPYMNFQKDRNRYAGDVARDGVPDDPWGNNYMLFTRAGVFLEPNGTLETGLAVLTTGGFTAGTAYNALDVFDRPTVLSLGPNGLPGDGIVGGLNGVFGKDDDYTRPFGAATNAP